MFSKAVDYLKNYRKHRAAALNNKEVQRWFLSDAKDMTELFGDTFSSTTENADWAALTAKGSAGYLPIQGVRIKIAFLAGCRHDLRGLFAVGTGHTARNEGDFDRHTIHDMAAGYTVLDRLAKVVSDKEAGAKTI